MICYYQLLEIASTASDVEIKRAYKKRALECHPDKQLPEFREKANQLFSDIQQAYEVLSDGHGRAWYDSHREAILKGSDPLSHSPSDLTTKETLMKYFGNCFHGFNDNSDGYFTVYRKLFDSLQQEEDNAFKTDNEAECSNYSNKKVTFGFFKSKYEDIIPFYDFWLSFRTIKSFRWFDKYNLSEAPDRNTRRYAERLNKKMREAAKKEYNETIENLVKFVRKNDPRYKEYLQIQELKAEEKKLETQAKINLQKLERTNNIEGFIEQDWSRVDETIDSDFENNLYDEYECVVCEKVFLSDKKLLQHEKSKGHLKKVEDLKREFAIEEGDLELSDEEYFETTPEFDSDKNSTDIPLQADNQNITSELNIKNLKIKPKKPKKCKNKTSNLKTISLKCNTCSKVFETRNSLFEHIKKESHASEKIK